MTIPTATQRQESSLVRDLIYAARYYLGRPRVLLMLAAIAIVAGLVFNWGWLVAAGLAPILISTLPCLIMCALGVCMMCRSEKSSVPVHDAAEAAGPPTTLAVADSVGTLTGATSSAPRSIEAARTMSLEANPPGGVENCCQGPVNETKPQPAVDLKTSQEGTDSHA